MPRTRRTWPDGTRTEIDARSSSDAVNSEGAATALGAAVPQEELENASSLAPVEEDCLREQSQVTLPDIEYSARVQGVVNGIMQAVRQVPNAEVRAFGSSVNGFGENDSDVDLVLVATKVNLADALGLGKVSQRDLAPRTLKALQALLRREGFKIQERVLGAKVPILKMRFGNIACDLSLNNLLPVFNTQLLKSYADLDHRLVEITQTCKHWAKSHGVHGAPYGHFSSYAFTLMAIFYMQIRGALPCLQRLAESLPQIYNENGKCFNVAMEVILDSTFPKQSIDITFDDFVCFYREEFKWGEHVVSVRRGRCLTVSEYPKLKMKAEALEDEILHIEDPFDTVRNLNCVLNPGSNEKLWWALDSSSAPKPRESQNHSRRVWQSMRRANWQ